MHKSMALQNELTAIFDITFDCEDGAATGSETDHARLVAQLIASEQNTHQRIGARIHDIDSAFFDSDLEIILGSAADAYFVQKRSVGLQD